MRILLSAICFLVLVTIFLASNYWSATADQLPTSVAVGSFSGSAPDSSETGCVPTARVLALTDKSAEIQANINQMFVRGGGTYIILEGDHAIDTPCTLKFGVSVLGVGRDATTIYMRKNNPAFVVDPDSMEWFTSGGGWSGTMRRSITREWMLGNMQISGNLAYCEDSTSQHGLSIVLRRTATDEWHAVTDFIVNNVAFKNLGGSGVHIECAGDTCASGLANCMYANYGVFRDCDFRQLNANSLYMKGRNIFLQFDNCNFRQPYNGTGYYTGITNPDGNPWKYYWNVMIVDHYQSDAEWGRANGIEFDRCDFESSTYDSGGTWVSGGVYIQNHMGYVHFEDCWFENLASVDVPWRCIYVDSTRADGGLWTWYRFKNNRSLSIKNCNFQGMHYSPALVQVTGSLASFEMTGSHFIYAGNELDTAHVRLDGHVVEALVTDREEWHHLFTGPAPNFAGITYVGISAGDTSATYRGLYLEEDTVLDMVDWNSSDFASAPNCTVLVYKNGNTRVTAIPWGGANGKKDQLRLPLKAGDVLNVICKAKAASPENPDYPFIQLWLRPAKGSW